jgi:hypothetical protein
VKLQTTRILCSLACLCLASSAAAQQGPKKQLQAQRLADGSIVIDGKLDEPVWAQAQAGEDWVERTPSPGAAPKVPTFVRVLYDRDAFYVGVRAEFLPGDALRADTLMRDVSRIWQDDALTIKFDVRHDRSSSVIFVVNPAGAQLDGVAVDNGRIFRREFDAVWESAAHVDNSFWSAELRIPMAALGLQAGEGERVLGFNVSRQDNARYATYDWSALPPELGAWAATHYGELHGVKDVAGGSPFTLMPYFRYAAPSDPESDFRGGYKLGGDLRLRVGDDTWTELTVLTDFAQVDADDQVVNLDRFPLFFPERRPFFLSGLEVFEFGESGAAQLLFTRRIGRDAQSNQVPILGGLKAYGSHGAFDYGVLQVVTDDILTDVPRRDANGKRVPAGTPAASWTVGRLRANFAHPGYVGLMVGLRDDVDLPLHDDKVQISPYAHLSLGADSLVRALDDRLEVSGFVAYTRSEAAASADVPALAATTSMPTSSPVVPRAMCAASALSSKDSCVTEGAAYQARVLYNGKVLQPRIRTLVVSDDFDPKLGFVRRPGTIDTSATLPVVYRSDALGLASITTSVTSEFVHDDEASALLTRTLMGDVFVGFRNEWEFGLGTQYGLDVVQSDFALFDDLRVRAGRYSGAEAHASLSTPESRNPRASFDYSLNDAFFSGRSHDLGLSTSINFGPHLRVALGGKLTLLRLLDCTDVVQLDGATVAECGTDPMVTAPVDLHSESRATGAVNSTISVTPSTTLSADLTGQLNTQSKQALGLLRIRYRYMPGSDVFLVYQETHDYDDASSVDRRLIFKITYRYDAVL